MLSSKYGDQYRGELSDSLKGFIEDMQKLNDEKRAEVRFQSNGIRTKLPSWRRTHFTVSFVHWETFGTNVALAFHTKYPHASASIYSSVQWSLTLFTKSEWLKYLPADQILPDNMKETEL